MDWLLERKLVAAAAWQGVMNAWFGLDRRSCLFLDEIQLITGWEGFVRRLMDSEPIDVVISGSSAQMLSAEIASSMRGPAASIHRA